MVWKEIRNGELDSLKTTNSGICKFFGEGAEVTSFFSDAVGCKTDLQKTYRFKGYKCSLHEKHGFLNIACKDDCPLIQKEHL